MRSYTGVSAEKRREVPLPSGALILRDVVEWGRGANQRCLMRTTASYVGLRAASPRSSKAARGASKKRDTRCEVALRRSVFRLGLRYAVSASDLPGKPDLAFRSARVVVFCDGDFWHGKDLEARLARLANGHNAPYWV